MKTEKVGLKTANAVTVRTQILLAENPKASLKNEGTQKTEDKALTGKNTEEKNARGRNSLLFIARQASRYSNRSATCRLPFWGSISCTFMQLVLPSVATLGDHMASFNWLLWNQILLFEELSGGDTWRRICRGHSESVRGGVSLRCGCFLQRRLEEQKGYWKKDILREKVEGEEGRIA